MNYKVHSSLHHYYQGNIYSKKKRKIHIQETLLLKISSLKIWISPFAFTLFLSCVMGGFGWILVVDRPYRDKSLLHEPKFFFLPRNPYLGMMILMHQWTIIIWLVWLYVLCHRNDGNVLVQCTIFFTCLFF